MAHNKAQTAFRIYFLKGITPVINMITERCSQLVHSLLSSFTRVVKTEKGVLMFISWIIIEMKDTVGEAPTSIFFEIIWTQICVLGDLNLGGWIVYPLP
jgi:hypothetical protein